MPRPSHILGLLVLAIGVTLAAVVQHRTPELRTISYRAHLYATRYAGGGNVLTGIPSVREAAPGGHVVRSGQRSAPRLSRSSDHALRFSTYLGGSGYDVSAAVAMDVAGYVYVAGTTTSADFQTRNPVQPYAGGLAGTDVFVGRFSPGGDTLVYATHLGGSGDELLTAMAVDGEGRAYVAGSTNSPDFPRRHALYSYMGGGVHFSDAFVARLSADGSSVDFATHFGGSGDDVITALTLGDDGSIYFAGTTTSDDLPTTASSFRPFRIDTVESRTDVFVARFSPDGDDRYRLDYATYLGGTGNDVPTDLVADPEGAVWVSGFTSSIDFPVQNALQDAFSGPFREGEGDAFLVRIRADGSDLDFSTYLGGSQDDQATGVALDETGSVYVTGWTESTDFPSTPGAYQPERLGIRNRFVVKLSPAGAAWTLDSATYVGSSGFDPGVAGLVVDDDERVWIAGATNSDALPLSHPVQPFYGGGNTDGFLARLDPDGARLEFSTFLGGSGADVVTSLAIGSGVVCVTGSTGSADFPTAGAVQGTFDGPATSGDEVTSAFLACFETAGTTGVSVETFADLPADFALHGNYPNPFNPQTIIPFDVKERVRVVLSVYDVLGRRVATLVDREYAAGRYEARFDGRHAASGTYFYVIEMGDFRDVGKMMLVR